MPAILLVPVKHQNLKSYDTYDCSYKISAGYSLDKSKPGYTALIVQPRYLFFLQTGWKIRINWWKNKTFEESYVILTDADIWHPSVV